MKKGDVSLISVILILVSVFIFLFFYQNWFNSYLSSKLVDNEVITNDLLYVADLKGVYSGKLLFFYDGVENISISKIKIGDEICIINQTFLPSLIELNLSDCVYFKDTSLEVVLYSDRGIFVKNYFIKEDNPNNFKFQTFSKIFGIGGGVEVFKYFEKENDNSYLFLGNSDTIGAGAEDFWLIKTDGSGNQIWEKTYGTSLTEEAEVIQVLNDGNYLIAGDSGFGPFNFWLVKLDSDGNHIWNKTYDFSGNEHVRGLLELPNGDFILSGYSDFSGNNDILILRINSSGDQIWNKTFGGSNQDFIKKEAVLTSDNYLLLAGYSNSFTASNAGWVLKINLSNGVEIWNKTYDRSLGTDRLYGIKEINDGNYVAVGYVSENLEDSWILKINSSTGDEIWNKTFGDSNYENFRNFVEDSNGNFFAIGLDGGSPFDVSLVKFDSLGNILFNKTYGTVSGNEIGENINLIENNYLVVSAYSNSFSGSGLNGWALKLDDLGNICDYSLDGDC